MEQQNENRIKWLHVRLTLQEDIAIKKAFKKTTERKVSDFVRKMILGRPMIAAVRNQSLQDILGELYRLRKDLNGAANNFNQAVKKLHLMQSHQSLDQWLASFKNREREMLLAIEEMKGFIAKTAEKWLQD